MRAKTLALTLVLTALTGCAPHITIADGTSGSGGEGEASGGGTTSSGGSFGGAMSSGGSLGGSTPSGGTASAGTNFGGSAGSAMPDSCARSLPDPMTFACDWRGALGGPGQSPAGYCSKSGCHNATTQAGNLNLTPDDFLVARLLNVPASFKISCGAGVPCDPVSATCDKCASCPPGAVLLSAANPGEGRMFDTMHPFVPGTTTTTVNIGCGDVMPNFNTTGTASYTQAHKDCLIYFFTELAKTPGNWPCQ
jgi:hypothetical protein